MTPTLVFDLETIPDVEGLRRLHGWGRMFRMPRLRNVHLLPEKS